MAPDETDVWHMVVNSFDVTTSEGPFGGGHVTSYCRGLWGPWDFARLDPVGPAQFPMVATARTVVDELVGRFRDRWPEGFNDPDGRQGFGGSDLAVWYGKALVAIVRKDRHGDPVGTVFDDVDLNAKAREHDAEHGAGLRSFQPRN